MLFELHFAVHFHIVHHLGYVLSLLLTKALYLVGNAHYAHCSKSDYGKGDVRMSHNFTLFVTKHLFSPFCELIIFYPQT